MTQRSQFFDSSGGDRVYSSASWAQVVAAVNNDGVVFGSGGGTAMQVIQNTPAAMNVKVSLGQVIIQGYYLEVYSAMDTLTISAANPSNPRIDVVVARRDLTGRTCLLAVLTGTPAVSPSAPALTQNAAGVWEIALAQVAVAAGATSIVTVNITDVRTFAQGPDVAATLNTASGHRHTGADSRLVRYTDLASVPTQFAPTDHGHTASGDGGLIAYTSITGKPTAFAPADHTHLASGVGGVVSHQVLTGLTATDHHPAPASGPDADISVDTAGAAGGAATFARASHGHKLLTYVSVPPAVGTGAAGTSGAAPARGDHTHSGYSPHTAGGGAAGTKIWEGTTDPGGSAAEGDIWIDG